MEDKKHCFDYDGNKIEAGDEVYYYPLTQCRGEPKPGIVWVVGDMNENNANMPYIRGKGVWDPSAIKLKEKNVEKAET